MPLLLILHAPYSFVFLILYRVSCHFIFARFEHLFCISCKVHCADAMKQSILPLTLVGIPIVVGLDSNAIGSVIFMVAPVNAVSVCLFSVAVASIFDELALVVVAIFPSVGPLSIKISICKFAFIFIAIGKSLLAEAVSLVILNLPLISTIVIGDHDSRAVHLVIEPVAFISNVDMIFGINHLAFAFSFAILQLASVETSILVLFYSLIYLAVALILSVIDILLVISLFGGP